MAKGPKIGQLTKLLLELPVSERQAIIRRARLRSVDGNTGQFINNSAYFNEDILCKLPEHQPGKIDTTGKPLRHKDCILSPPVATHKKEDLPKGPINNFPPPEIYEGGLTDPVTLEIFSLRRRNAELTSKVEGLNNKLTRALECLYSTRRFIQLWVFEGQGESYDQVHARIQHLDSTIAHVEDRSIEPSPGMEPPVAWKKKH